MGMNNQCTITGQLYKSVINTSVAVNATASMIVGTTLSTGALDAGTYKLGWFYAFSMSTAIDDFQAQIKVGSTVVASFNIEESDSTTLETQCGFYYLTESTGGTSYTITLNFAAEAGTATLQAGSGLEFWRVA